MTAVYTVGEICKKCYSCVRACPTKAIEVHEGQADIIEEMCISCGYCVSMCAIGAKRIRSSVGEVESLLDGGSGACVAMLAPSFPAAFLDTEPELLVGGLAAAGFDSVYEVAFGADLVSYAYYRLFQQSEKWNSDRFLISTPCPAVVSYVEKVYPDLVPFLAGVMSPMEATARTIKEKIDPEAHIVFIGPCVAKKEEKQRLGLVDEVLTFQELVELFEHRGVNLAEVGRSEFDAPRANLGRIYPVTGGLLKAASIDADLLASPAYVVEGQERVSEILAVLDKRVKTGAPVVNRLFDLLFCEGCIAGPAIPNELSFYERKKYIIQYMKSKELVDDIKVWAANHESYTGIDISKSFRPQKLLRPIPTEEDIREILAKTNKFSKEDELNCRACGYNSCREKAVAVFHGTAEVEMCLPYLINKLETAISDLQNNQARLIQAEKLASMGQMAAGIAHEINNPLGIVLMYAHLLKEQMDSTNPVSEDVDTIIKESDRARKIVQGILNFARKEKIERVPTDINALVKEAGEEARLLAGDGTIKVLYDLDPVLGIQQVDPNQMRQVFDNILKNAVEFMPQGGTITIVTRDKADEFCVRISDEGPGIPQESFSQIFSPFFTTKPVGKGTGLGLPVCYGIVKMHGGSIQPGNNPDRGAYFDIRIRHSGREEQHGTHTHS